MASQLVRFTYWLLNFTQHNNLPLTFILLGGKTKALYSLDGKETMRWKSIQEIPRFFPEMCTCTTSICTVHLLKKIQSEFTIALISFNTFKHIFLYSRISGCEKTELNFNWKLRLNRIDLQQVLQSVHFPLNNVIFTLLFSRLDWASWL